ncbi:unnamed protein product [Durusdinium trenchii]|uniref:N-formylglutamate amidohydrolase n=1 Tax=Durusdinium trenchii TaxID=1381693 RepID=A0ABP0M4F8_9DINO
MASLSPKTPLQRREGGADRAPVLLVAPHATAELDTVASFVAGWPENRPEVAEEMNEWHDEGSGEAFEVCCTQLQAPGFRPILPRGLMDLNRGWLGRTEEAETLFGKGALSAWSKEHLKVGASELLETWYRNALHEIRMASELGHGMVEIHSYGDLGSTYDRLRGGRPLRRSEAAVVLSTPWATQLPVGLARLLPGDLRGTPKALERLVDEELERAGFHLGPSPYPAQGPWALSTRFLAARWFRWLAQKGHLPSATAEHLVTLAWCNEHDAETEQVATGQLDARNDHSRLQGVRELALRMGDWSHAASQLGDEFCKEAGCFTLVIEMRCDLVKSAEAFGTAIAEALRRYTA